MTRRCTVCELATVAAVDRELVTGGGNISALAKRHGVSRNALLRHKDAHLPKHLVEARAEGAPDRSAQLLYELQALQERVGGFIDAASARNDIRGAVTALREATRLIELIAKLKGDLQPPPPVTINMVQSLEFQTVCARVIGALEGEPVARAKVVAALQVLH